MDKTTLAALQATLLAYLDGQRPEEILSDYPSLTLEEIFATLTYHQHCREQVDAYLKAHREYCEEARQRFHADPPPGVRRFLERVGRLPSEELARTR